MITSLEPYEGIDWSADNMRNIFGMPYSPQNGSQYCLEEENYYGHYKKMSKIFHCCSLSVLSIMLIEEPISYVHQGPVTGPFLKLTQFETLRDSSRTSNLFSKRHFQFQSIAIIFSEIVERSCVK